LAGTSISKLQGAVLALSPTISGWLATVITAKRLKTFEKRSYPRIAYSGHIFFATKDRLFEGELKDFSRFGLGIKAAEVPLMDEVITIALPFSDGRKRKCKGQIVWTDNSRFGVELFRKRTDPELRIIK
jgi:hypothetical protein